MFAGRIVKLYARKQGRMPPVGDKSFLETKKIASMPCQFAVPSTRPDQIATTGLVGILISSAATLAHVRQQKKNSRRFLVSPYARTYSRVFSFSLLLLDSSHSLG